MKTHLVVLAFLVTLTGPNQPATALGQNKPAQKKVGTVALIFDRAAIQSEARKLTATLTRPGYASIKKPPRSSDSGNSVCNPNAQQRVFQAVGKRITEAPTPPFGLSIFGPKTPIPG